MSWMDSWSRPGKHSATPPPLYLTQGESTPYCNTCGRVISARKSQSTQPVKYCSSRCRNQKPQPPDRRIEDAFVALLDGQVPDSAAKSDSSTGATPALGALTEKLKEKKKKIKGDPRITVKCDEIETLVFGSRHDPSKVHGRKKNRASRVLGDEDAEWKSVDMVEDVEGDFDGEEGVPGKADGDDDELNSAYRHGAGKVRPPQSQRDVNASVGGEKGWAERGEETEEMKEKRLQGQRRAEEKEMVRRAARRGVVFGFVVKDKDGDDGGAKKTKKAGDGKGDQNVAQAQETRRKCEAVMNGVVVEPSFAKGDWGIRWREK